MSLPRDARDLFEEGSELEDARIVSARITDRGSVCLGVDLGFPEGRTTLVLIHYDTPEGPIIKVDYDEPPGAGADPYGRPDPHEHPEAWTE